MHIKLVVKGQTPAFTIILPHHFTIHLLKDSTRNRDL